MSQSAFLKPITCPFCKQSLSVTYNVLSREKYRCVLCDHTFDIDDVEDPDDA